jgi:4-amino-4-deoxy-L-arabinose transferase-like glycosyltransferase
LSRARATPAPLANAAPAGLSRSFDWLRALRDVNAQTHLLWLGGILLVALVLRVVWVSNVQPDPRDGRFDDSVWYYGAGRHLADGDGYVYPLDTFCAGRTDEACAGRWQPGDKLQPTALWAPGYPLVLAALFRFPGDDVAAARALNVIAGLALIAGVYYLTTKLWSRTAGLFAATAMAFFPSHIYFSSLLLSESVFAAAAVLLLCLALAWTLGESTPRWRVFALGLAAGCVGMLRPEGAFIIIAIVGTWIAVHRSWRRVAMYTGLLVLGMAVLYVPWTVRNAVQLNAPVVGTTGMGQVLIQGHNPHSGGRPDLFVVTQLWDRYQNVPLPEREVRINNKGISESIDYAVHHVPREFSLIPQRLAWFFRGDDTVVFWLQNAPPGHARPFSTAWYDHWRVVANVYYYAICGIMVFGLPFWLRRMNRRHALIWGPFAVYAAMWAFIFVGEARYHFPLLPVFSILAAIGLAAALERLGALRTVPADSRSTA